MAKVIHDSRTGARQRGYTWAWEKARLRFLRDNPLCVMCGKDGRVAAASVVDHIKPHRGDLELFWAQANWQALCKPHHDSTKKSDELSGRVRGADVSGLPTDPGHSWNTNPE